jgi:hypothetical protein
MAHTELPRLLSVLEMMMNKLLILLFALILGACQPIVQSSPAADLSTDRYQGRHYSGRGDVEYLHLLEIARSMFEPNPELQNMAMLYTPVWNGLHEGPTWDAWWIQNSYGTTYSALPFYQEPFVTFINNSHDLWFDQMGDGRRKGQHDWVGPDGCLCDCAAPGMIYYKQGDGRINIHDWGVGFTAAGLLMQSELLLISRNRDAMAHYLPMLERSADFLDSRRDKTNNLFLAGPAGNLLAPSYAGWQKPNGSYGMAYLAELSVTCLAALDRLIEVEKLFGNPSREKLFRERRELIRQGLSKLTTSEGYFIRSMDPDGVKHGVYGASQHGYLETTPNHDAIAFRVVDEMQAEKIYAKIASLPQLRPFTFILPNYPAYDDMYEKETSIWIYGTWINGGHWSTCEGRMMLAYYRLGKFTDARNSMKQILTFASRFRMDNPLTHKGADVYQPKEPINLTYDAFAVPAAFIRGLYEYIYTHDGLRLYPHIPSSISELRQLDPIRFGNKKIYLSAYGTGPVTAVLVNGRKHKDFDGKSLFLSYKKMPDVAHIVILLGNAKANQQAIAPARDQVRIAARLESDTTKSMGALYQNVERLQKFYDRLVTAGLSDSYEAAHTRLAIDSYAAIFERRRLAAAGKLNPLPERSRIAADSSYFTTAKSLQEGLDKTLRSYENKSSVFAKKIWDLYRIMDK